MIIIDKKQTTKKEDLIFVIMDLVIKMDNNTLNYDNVKKIFDFYKINYTERKYR